MVTSIVLTGKYNIGISSSNKILTPDGITINLKDIPFVRYRFDSYGPEEIAFIQENKKKFPCVHIVEVMLDGNTKNVLDTISDMDEMIGKIVYVPVYNEDVSTGISQNMLELVQSIKDCDFDRLMIKDKSDTLYALTINRIKKQIASVSGFKENDIGVCGGPGCFANGQACLTAVRAREMLAQYSERDDIVVPSSNHEGKMDSADDLESCTNHCGCIRYHVYTSNMDAPISESKGKKGKANKSKDTNTEKKETTKEKKVSKPKLKGFVEVDW